MHLHILFVNMHTCTNQEFRISLAHTRWMDPASRKAAQVKLDKMFMEVAYPVDWPESVHRNDGKLKVSVPIVYMFACCNGTSC